jgi:hypothetical protein
MSGPRNPCERRNGDWAASPCAPAQWIETGQDRDAVGGDCFDGNQAYLEKAMRQWLGSTDQISIPVTIHMNLHSKHAQAYNDASRQGHLLVFAYHGLVSAYLAPSDRHSLSKSFCEVPECRAHAIVSAT